MRHVRIIPARGSRGGLSSMVEHRIVAPKVMGSKPIGHPTTRTIWAACSGVA